MDQLTITIVGFISEIIVFYKLKFDTTFNNFISCNMDAENQNPETTPEVEEQPQKKQEFTKKIIYVLHKVQNINCIEEPADGFGGLYLGDIVSAIKPEILEENEIKAILTCNIECNSLPESSSRAILKKISAFDTLDYPINIHFEETFQFIEEMRQKNKNVLVHCHAGISRSVAIVCAYLMKKKSWNFLQTREFIRNKRPRAGPNIHFAHLLQHYEKQLIQSRQKLRSSYDDSSTSHHSRKASYETPSRRKSLGVVKTASQLSDKKIISIGDRNRRTRKRKIPWELLETNYEPRSLIRNLFEIEKDGVDKVGCCI